MIDHTEAEAADTELFNKFRLDLFEKIRDMPHMGGGDTDNTRNMVASTLLLGGILTMEALRDPGHAHFAASIMGLEMAVAQMGWTALDPDKYAVFAQRCDTQEEAEAIMSALREKQGQQMN